MVGCQCFGVRATADVSACIMQAAVGQSGGGSVRFPRVAKDGELDSMRRAMRRMEQARNGQLMRWVPALTTVLWMALIFALSARSTIPVPLGMAAGLTAIAGHLVAYAVLAALIWWMIDPLNTGPRRRFALALIGAVAYGLTDEWHQSFVSGRDASALDIAVDAIGALGGLIVVRRLPRLRTDD